MSVGGNAFAAPVGTIERSYLLTSWERRLAFRVVARIGRESGSTVRTVNLEYACLEYGGGPDGEPHPETLCPPAERNFPFRVYPHEDQAEVIDMALSKAKAAIGVDDDAAAFVHVLREVYPFLAGKQP